MNSEISLLKSNDNFTDSWEVKTRYVKMINCLAILCKRAANIVDELNKELFKLYARTNKLDNRIEKIFADAVKMISSDLSYDEDSDIEISNKGNFQSNDSDEDSVKYTATYHSIDDFIEPKSIKTVNSNKNVSIPTTIKIQKLSPDLMVENLNIENITEHKNEELKYLSNEDIKIPNVYTNSIRSHHIKDKSIVDKKFRLDNIQERDKCFFKNSFKDNHIKLNKDSLKNTLKMSKSPDSHNARRIHENLMASIVKGVRLRKVTTRKPKKTNNNNDVIVALDKVLFSKLNDLNYTKTLKSCDDDISCCSWESTN